MPEMQQIEVYVYNGEVYIQQDVLAGEGAAIVSVHPDQVPTLCKWLMEAADNARKPTPKAPEPAGKARTCGTCTERTSCDGGWCWARSQVTSADRVACGLYQAITETSPNRKSTFADS